MNDLKIRVSYAQVGNVDIGAFPYVGTFGSAQYASQNGIGFAQAGNPELKWERSKKENYGIDFGFFNNRLTGSVDYFPQQHRRADSGRPHAKFGRYSG